MAIVKAFLDSLALVLGLNASGLIIIIVVLSTPVLRFGRRCAPATTSATAARLRGHDDFVGALSPLALAWDSGIVRVLKLGSAWRFPDPRLDHCHRRAQRPNLSMASLTDSPSRLADLATRCRLSYAFRSVSNSMQEKDMSAAQPTECTPTHSSLIAASALVRASNFQKGAPMLPPGQDHTFVSGLEKCKRAVRASANFH